MAKTLILRGFIKFKTKFRLSIALFVKKGYYTVTIDKSNILYMGILNFIYN